MLVAATDVSTTLTIAPNFDLAGALKGGRLAIANPDSVPAGKYGRAALTSLGVWNSVADHLAQAENVRAALTFVAHGEAPLGIVYETDAKAEPKGEDGRRVSGKSSHAPILYPAALTRTAGPAAQGFHDLSVLAHGQGGIRQGRLHGSGQVSPADFRRDFPSVARLVKGAMPFLPAESDVLETASRWLAAGHKVALATVVATSGSAPRQKGSHIAVRDERHLCRFGVGGLC